MTIWGQIRTSAAMIPAMLTTLALAQFNSSNIIELPVSRFPEPKCSYTVLHDDYYGKKVVGKINIGDPLYHKWECDYGERNSVDIYCMMVHNCTVTSQRQQQPIEIIDEFGCTLFPQVISNIRYGTDLKAGLKVQAFSLDVDETTSVCHRSAGMATKKALQPLADEKLIYKIQ